jgi:hypothetical protein
MSHTDRVAVVVILAIELLIVLFVPRLPAGLLRWPLTGGRMRRGTAASLLAVLLIVAIARLP